ncbi:hypothetical protein [Pseudomonas boanensis]|uniref:hypothetical protein n=1 Tax=Metapseudomonas boanensis TaxID=2822138 RepID=UPI0035D3E1E2
MLLNGSSLNGAPLNGGTGQAQVIEVAAAPAFVWRALVTLGGVDVSARLIGEVSVDREEGAAGVAEFVLFYPPGDAVPTDITDRAVTVDLISTTGGVTSQTRRFTGVVAEPTWDALNRTLAITATDNLQQRVEALSVVQIDALVGGLWSTDVFDELEGRSRWDYAQERLSTRTASLDCSPSGQLRVVSWYAALAPHYVFGPGTTLYQSVNVELAQLRNVTNRLELEVAYRYSRFREHRQSYTWSHPGTQGLGGIQGFCAWRQDSTELPDISMVIGSVGDGGQVPVSADWYRLPPTMANPCGDGAAWVNNNEDLLLGASLVGALRWVQTVTETYNLILTTEAGQVEGQQVISRDGTSFEIEPPEGWEDSLKPITGSADGNGEIADPAPGLGEPGDRDDETRRTATLGLLLHKAHTEIIAAHRETRVSWAVPTPMALNIDLLHTLKLEDQYVRAMGKCSRLTDRLNFETGECLTELTISVMRGGGEGDPLAIPARPGALPPEEGGGITGSGLATQLGGKFTSPAYDDELDGFAGNYSSVQDTELEVFPRRMDVEAAEIPAELRDEHQASTTVTYRVAIPNDLLEL